MVHSGDEATSESEFGSSGKREVTGYTAGLHSPWGILGQVAKDRGISIRKVLWGDSWLNYQLYTADAPRYVSGKRPAPVVESLEELRKLRGTEEE